MVEDGVYVREDTKFGSLRFYTKRSGLWITVHRRSTRYP